MKKVEALIRPERMEPVMDELRELGYPGLTITEVRGHGKQKGLLQRWRGAEYHVEFLPKIKIEAVVLDEDLGKVVGAVVSAARTGSIGDGKVFVHDVADVVRIRTGESGQTAV
ncbi:MAG: P-II family nitrogen regulator [Actinomycetota bacterium]